MGGQVQEKMCVCVCVCVCVCARCEDGKRHSYTVKKKLLGKVCTEECIVFLLTLGSVASDTHTTRFVGGMTG